MESGLFGLEVCRRGLFEVFVLGYHGMRDRVGLRRKRVFRADICKEIMHGILVLKFSRFGVLRFLCSFRLINFRHAGLDVICLY